MKAEVIRREIHRLIKQSPFRPFVLSLENGDRVTIEHPENIAFDPGDGNGQGSRDFYVLTSQIRLYGTFEAVSLS